MSTKSGDRPVFEVRSPAGLYDMAAMSGAGSRLQWFVAREMWAQGQTFALDRDGQLVGLFGFYPVGEGAEAWFAIGADMSGYMGFVIRQIRLTLMAQTYSDIVVICTTPQGRRIAALCGFQFRETCDVGEIWQWKVYSAAVAALARQRSCKSSK